MFGAWLAQAGRVSKTLRRQRLGTAGSLAFCFSIVFTAEIAYIRAMLRTPKRNQQQRPRFIAVVARVRMFAFPA